MTSIPSMVELAPAELIGDPKLWRRELVGSGDGDQRWSGAVDPHGRREVGIPGTGAGLGSPATCFSLAPVGRPAGRTGSCLRLRPSTVRAGSRCLLGWSVSAASRGGGAAAPPVFGRRCRRWSRRRGGMGMELSQTAALGTGRARVETESREREGGTFRLAA